MTPTLPKVLTIILNYNTWELTAACLASLTHTRSVANTIIVVDNGSKNDSVAQLMHWNYGPPPAPLPVHQSLRQLTEALPGHSIAQLASREPHLPSGTFLIACDENRGFSGGNNAALGWVNANDYDCIWFLNNDTLVDPHALQNKLDDMRANPSVGMVAPVLRHMHHPSAIQTIGGTINQWLGTTTNICNLSTPVDYLCGASVLLSQRCFSQVGTWDEQFFLNYEDADLSYRIKAKGFDIEICKSAIVYHKESATFNAELKCGNDMVEQSRLMSRKKFAKKYQLSQIGVRVGFLLSALVRIRRKQFALAWFALRLAFDK
jgi:GT2 family glycosyltransferase